MGISPEFVLTMSDVEINKKPGTDIPDLFYPVVGIKHGKYYTPEGFLTSGGEEYVQRELKMIGIAVC